MAETAPKPESMTSDFLFGGLALSLPLAVMTSCSVAFSLILLNAASSCLPRLPRSSINSSRSVCGLPVVEVFFWVVLCTRWRFAGRKTVRSESSLPEAPMCLISRPFSCNRPTMSSSIAFLVTPPSSMECPALPFADGIWCKTPPWAATSPKYKEMDDKISPPLEPKSKVTGLILPPLLPQCLNITWVARALESQTLRKMYKKVNAELSQPVSNLCATKSTRAFLASSDDFISLPFSSFSVSFFPVVCDRA
mmetsp:Transcript_52437/g.97073  ORF Transcript_52437/g.97073 Transcript_52437/m.97073 type:complete len:251 (+) Transcript_52437:1091-1843(+)